VSVSININYKFRIYNYKSYNFFRISAAYLKPAILFFFCLTVAIAIRFFVNKISFSYFCHLIQIVGFIRE